MRYVDATGRRVIHDRVREVIRFTDHVGVRVCIHCRILRRTLYVTMYILLYRIHSDRSVLHANVLNVDIVLGPYSAVIVQR